jgi:hypothetical protein
VVIAPVGNDLVEPLARSPNLACDGRDAVDEREQLSNSYVKRVYPP